MIAVHLAILSPPPPINLFQNQSPTLPSTATAVSVQNTTNMLETCLQPQEIFLCTLEQESWLGTNKQTVQACLTTKAAAILDPECKLQVKTLQQIRRANPQELDWLQLHRKTLTKTTKLKTNNKKKTSVKTQEKLRVNLSGRLEGWLTRNQKTSGKFSCPQ